MPRMRLLPVSAHEPKIQDAYEWLKFFGLLNCARELARKPTDTDRAFLEIRELLPESARPAMDWFDEDDCDLLVSLIHDSDLIEAGVEWI